MGKLVSGLWIALGFYEHPDNHDTCWWPTKQFVDGAFVMGSVMACKQGIEATGIIGTWKGLLWRVEGRLHVGEQVEYSQRWPPSLYSKGRSFVLFGINRSWFHNGEQLIQPGGSCPLLASNPVISDGRCWDQAWPSEFSSEFIRRYQIINRWIRYSALTGLRTEALQTHIVQDGLKNTQTMTQRGFEGYRGFDHLGYSKKGSQGLENSTEIGWWGKFRKLAVAPRRGLACRWARW